MGHLITPQHDVILKDRRHPHAREGQTMLLFTRYKRHFIKPHLWLIALVGVIVPRRLRADWRLLSTFSTSA